MAVKTITIDLEAYEALSRRKRAGQSFSQVIKEHFGTARTAAELLSLVRSWRPDRDTLDAVERQIRARKKSPARAPRA